MTYKSVVVMFNCWKSFFFYLSLYILRTRDWCHHLFRGSKDRHKDTDIRRVFQPSIKQP